MFKLLATLLTFQFLGELLARILSLGIPGPVAGMLLMLFFLFTKRSEAEKLAPACHRLLSHLALFFVPAATGIMTQVGSLTQDWLAIGLALIASGLASIVVTAVVIHRLSK